MQIYWNKTEFLHKKRFNSHGTGLEHQHGRLDFMWNLYRDRLPWFWVHYTDQKSSAFLSYKQGLCEWNWVDHISTSCFQEVLRSCGILFYAEALFFFLEWREMLSGTLKISGKEEDIILKDCGNLNAECILVVKLKWRLFVQTAGKKGKLELKTKQASRRHKKSKPTTSFGGKGSLDSRSPGTPLSRASLLTVSPRFPGINLWLHH